MSTWNQTDSVKLFTQQLGSGQLLPRRSRLVEASFVHSLVGG